jgi:hypothetical protein
VKCSDCEYAYKVKASVKIHIESKHIDTGGITCQDCEKLVPTRNALKVDKETIPSTLCIKTA